MESHPIENNAQESKKLVYIRADGNEDIATGHLMRCLSIARALLRRDAQPVFMVSDMTSIRLLQKMMPPEEQALRCFPIIHMQTDYREPEKELPVLENIFSSRKNAALLVDSYFVTPRYLSTLKQLCHVAYIDDLQAFDYPVDLVINYDILVDSTFYKKTDRLLSGVAYTPLREQFSQSNYHPWDTVKDLFISTGGTDPFNIAGGLARRLLTLENWKDVCLHILTGPMHVHRHELEALAESDSRVILHENVTEMAALMEECDLAFSAGGTTLYELCAVGVPSVSYTMADNQIPGVKAFAEAGLIPWIGDVRDNPDFFEKAVSALHELASDANARREQSLRMRMAIDGAGADRIAEALMLMG